MRIGSERAAVQNPIIQYAQEIGWEYIEPDEALRLRGGDTELILKETFINQIQALNPDYMDHLLAEDLIKRLWRIQPNIEGNLVAWEHLKGLRSVFVPHEKRERDVRLIDTERIDNNAFHVTDEFSFTNGKEVIRPDIVFLVNGIPVLFFETKSAHKIEGIAEALDQVRRYHWQCPELLAILQVYALTHLISYYYSATWNTTKKLLYSWKDEISGDFEGLVKAFLSRERVVKILTDFILFTREDDELKKVVLRPHQMRAVGRLTDRARSKKKRRGLIWHTQGSGKTYTMIVTAQKILENPIFDNPTVIMLVDRNELEAQLFGNIRAVGIERVEVTESKRHLRQLLSNDRRGLIVSMIHKFEGMPAKINERKNIFVLVDEAHRTTGGKLGNYLMGALPKAAYMGFTGTPIDRTSYGEGTFVIFGKDDPPHGYLDKYSVAESIEDGATVPLHYNLAPSELRVDKETLEEEFLDLSEAYGVSDVEELNRVLEKAVNLRNMLKNSERVERIGRFVAKHYVDYVEPMGYKAFLVAVDREACALYKSELDKHLPKEYSEVVYSPFHNDPPGMRRYHYSKEKEKRIRKAFKKAEELPKILIVTAKLLTGFDAPILYCMYLDKPMRDHVLLQAIARVNRPHEDEEGRKKPSGFILDFVGIFENLEKALAFDSADIEGVVSDIGVLKERFTELMDIARKDYLKLIGRKKQDKAVEAVLNHFMEEEGRREYYKFFKELSSIYDILSPDKFLRPYLDGFDTLARMFSYLKGAYDSGIEVDREFSRKTAKLVQEHTSSGRIKATLDIYEINADTLRKIEESEASDAEKIFNILKGVEELVEKESPEAPYLHSIGEKAKLIAQRYQQRQISTQEALEEFRKLIEETNEAKREQAEKDMPVDVFTVFWLLKTGGIDEPEEKANQMRDVLKGYPHYKRSVKHERAVKQELGGVLIKSGMEDVSRITDIVNGIMNALKRG